MHSPCLLRNRKKLIAIPVLTLFLIILSISPAVQAVNTIAAGNWTIGGAKDDYTYGIAASSDGGFLLVGSTSSYGAGKSDAWLVKTDSNGAVEWNRTYGGAGNDFGCNMIATPDGGYALVGYSDPFGSSMEGWLIKVDAQGNMQWNQTYNGAGAEYPANLVATSDGGYILIGSVFSEGATQCDGLIIKTDAAGTMQWNKTVGGAEGSDYLWDIIAADGGYVIVGSTASSGAGADDLWLLKINSDGAMQWNRTYGGSHDDFGWWIVPALDGGYVVSGATSSWGAGKFDAWILKTDLTGNLLWNQTIGGAEDDFAYDMITTADGGYAAAGYTFSYGENGDAWLIQTDATGVLVWNQTFGGAGFDQAQGLSATSEGDYALAACTGSFGVGSTDGWLIVAQAPVTQSTTQNLPLGTGATALVAIVALIAVTVVVFLKYRKYGTHTKA